MADRVGQQVGHYRLMRLLGRGGFAEVYLGEHIHLETEAAIKLLHTYLVDKDKEAFRKEARTIARLVYPNIVRVFDFGIENDFPFLVMDYAPNGTLRSRHPKGTELPLPTIIDYVRQIANALQYAHDERFVHCDIKPENLLVGRQQEILLTDFGIARIAQTSRSQSIQHVAGTASYMAPEQFQGKPCAASDQYALAIMVYEWLTGTYPFQGTFVALAGQHLLAPPPPLQRTTSTLSPTVEQVVMTALAKDPKQRFDSVMAFATALQQAIASPQPQEHFTTHQLTKATDTSLSTNQISESLIPTEQGKSLHPSPSSTGQTTPSPKQSSTPTNTDATAPHPLTIQRQIEQQSTQPLPPDRPYQPNMPTSPPPSTDPSKQTLYTARQNIPPIQQAVHSQPPHPARNYPYFNRIVGILLLIIVLVGGSFLLINSGIFPGHSTNNANPTIVDTNHITPTPSPTATVILLGCPTLTNLASNANGTQQYNATIQAEDKTGTNNGACNILQEKPITAAGITCRIWVESQNNDLNADLRNDAAQLQHPETFNQQPFPHEISDALIFDPTTPTQTQPCLKGTAQWKFIISPTLPKGNYFLVGLTDWQGQNWNWTAIQITVT